MKMKLFEKLLKSINQARKLNKGNIGYERHAVIFSYGKCRCAVCNRNLPFTRGQIETKEFGEFITNKGCIWCDTEYCMEKEIKQIEGKKKVKILNNLIKEMKKNGTPLNYYTRKGNIK